TSVQGTEQGTLQTADSAVYRLQTGVAGSLYVTLTAGSDVQDGLTLTILAADGQTVLASDQGTGATADQTELVNLPVIQGQVVILQVSGIDAGALGGYTLHFTNFDQYQSPNNPTLFLPTGNNPTSIAVSDLKGN